MGVSPGGQLRTTGFSQTGQVMRRITSAPSDSQYPGSDGCGSDSRRDRRIVSSARRLLRRSLSAAHCLHGASARAGGGRRASTESSSSADRGAIAIHNGSNSRARMVPRPGRREGGAVRPILNQECAKRNIPCTNLETTCKTAGDQRCFCPISAPLHTALEDGIGLFFPRSDRPPGDGRDGLDEAVRTRCVLRSVRARRRGRARVAVAPPSSARPNFSSRDSRSRACSSKLHR